MPSKMDSLKLNRRSLLKTAALAGVSQIASPFVMTARAADTIKIGFANPLTGGTSSNTVYVARRP